jgi:hypothetical protein
MFMGIEGLVNAAEIIGGIAVIGSLIFVARQMRESNLNTREANYRQVMEHNIQMGRLIGSDSTIANLYRRGCGDMQQLNADERWQFGSLMMAMFCDFNQHYTMHKQNRLDPEFWKSIEHNIRFYISRPGVLLWWESQPFALDASFTKYIDDLIGSRQTDSTKDLSERA